jgi:hypothetical protein
MSLRRGAVEPAEPGRHILRHTVPVEQQLTVKRLRLGIALLGERMKKRRALPGVVREARGTDDGGGGCRRQNLNSTDPNTVRPGAIVA